MYKHILVPTDGSPLSMKAVRAAAKLAGALHARLTALYVTAPFAPPASYDGYLFPVLPVDYSAAEYRRSVKASAAKILARTAKAAGRVKCATATVEHVNPWQAIIGTARSKRCDLIVMASHGRRGISGLLLGSETQKVLTHSKVPVLVCR